MYLPHQMIPREFLYSFLPCLGSIQIKAYFILTFDLPLRVYNRHSTAAIAARIAFSCPALRLSFDILSIPVLLTTPVIQPPLMPIDAVSVKTVDDSIS